MSTIEFLRSARLQLLVRPLLGASCFRFIFFSGGADASRGCGLICSISFAPSSPLHSASTCTVALSCLLFLSIVVLHDIATRFSRSELETLTAVHQTHLHRWAVGFNFYFCNDYCVATDAANLPVSHLHWDLRESRRWMHGAEFSWDPINKPNKTSFCFFCCLLNADLLVSFMLSLCLSEELSTRLRERAS